MAGEEAAIDYKGPAKSLNDIFEWRIKIQT